MLSIIVFTTILYCCSLCLMIRGFFKKWKLSKNENNDLGSPKISVIIAIRNESRTILSCLESLEKQSFDNANFEIILINDHSTDNTLDIINSFIDSTHINIKVYNLTDATSKKEALKYGVEKAKHSIISTTDGDCVLPKNWLSQTSGAFVNDIDMLLGPVVFNADKGFLYQFQTLDMLAIQGIEFGTLYYRKPILNNGANLSYKKEVYKEKKGYDDYKTPSGDDIFLLEKFNNKQIEGILSKPFIVKTNIQNTFRDFWNQRLRWASKTKYYKNKLLIYFSWLIFIQNGFQMFIYYELLFSQKDATIFAILLLSKWLFDFILLFLTSSFFQRKKSLWYFIPVQILYPIYVIFIGASSKLMKFNWKEREFNG